MDFINQAASQIAELFRSMTVAARITTGLLVGILAVSLFFLFQHTANSGTSYLFNGSVLSPREIAAMEAAFAKAGLNEWEVTGNRVRVPRANRHAYLAALDAEQALPENSNSGIDAVIRDGNPFESRTMQENKLRVAKEKDLGYTIRLMRGIADATVKLEDVAKGGFPPRKERRALVAVEAMGKQPLSDEQVRAIRDTVASGAGVGIEHVTVTDLNAGRAYAGANEDGTPRADDNVYAATKRMFERTWQQKILDQLSMIPGVIVGVNVELDPDLNNQVESLKFDEKPTSVETMTSSKEATSTTPEIGGRPGAVPNGVVGNTPRAVSREGRGESTSNETREQNRMLAGRTQTVVHKAPLTPNRVTVAINVPKSYYEKVWSQENPAASGQEPRKPEAAEMAALEQKINKSIETSINNLLPKTTGTEEPFPRVQVAAYADIPMPPLEDEPLTDKALSWLGSSWSTLAMLGVGLISLGILRSTVRSVPRTPRPAASSSAAVAPGTPGAAPSAAVSTAAEEDEDEDAEQRRLKFQAGGRSLREELADLIREDPDAAANVLRNWIGDAA